MRTMTHASLTDRYVTAVLTGVPEDSGPMSTARLRASIGEAVEARVTRGEAPADAERAVLTELGDPMRVSAEYSGRPLHLIGPALYPDYVRLLRLLLAIIVPIVGVAVGMAQPSQVPNRGTSCPPASAPPSPSPCRWPSG